MGNMIQHKPKTWKPFILDEIFAVNEFDANKIIEHNIYEETIITYENLFKYPHKIKDYFLNTPAPRYNGFHWDLFESSGKNFVEYWDCRHYHILHQILELYEIIDKIIYLTYSYSPLSNERNVLHNPNVRSICSNLFQWKDMPPQANIPDYFGNQAHADGDARYAATACLNDEEDIKKNGIAFYESVHGIHVRSPETNHLIDTPDNVENGRSYYQEEPEKHWKLPPKFIEHNFNKVIIYPADMYHGAYHDKLDFMKYPRITIASFLV